jgi:hypothetical protein
MVRTVSAGVVSRERPPASRWAGTPGDGWPLAALKGRETETSGLKSWRKRIRRLDSTFPSSDRRCCDWVTVESHRELPPSAQLQKENEMSDCRPSLFFRLRRARNVNRLYMGTASLAASTRTAGATPRDPQPLGAAESGKNQEYCEESGADSEPNSAASFGCLHWQRTSRKRAPR